MSDADETPELPDETTEVTLEVHDSIIGTASDVRHDDGDGGD